MNVIPFPRARVLPVMILGPVCLVAGLLWWGSQWVQVPVLEVALGAGPAQAVAPVQAAPVEAVPVVTVAPSGALASFFTPEVLAWRTEIEGWAAAYAVDPNLVATVMQIESCGNPTAVSGAGAQGLFQVMPLHFSAGEVMLDPQTNATRGLNFLTEMLREAHGHPGLALAGYNGGYYAVRGSWAAWAPETRRYYHWGAGIYADAVSGLADSPTLHEWLESGGASLCAQARVVLGP